MNTTIAHSDNDFECQNVFECQHCEYWEVIGGDDVRWHMNAEYVRGGDTNEQYGLYICPDCKTEGWSQRLLRDSD